MSLAISPWLGRAVLAVMAVYFFGGLAMFPDAPIHRCEEGRNYAYANHPGGFCGKQGQAHTAADFRRFEVWQNNLFWLWAIGMPTIFLVVRTDRKNSRSGWPV